MAEPIDATLVRAAQLTTDGRPRAAIELLRPLLVVHPEHSGAWCRLSVAYLDAGEVDESLDAAKRAIRLGERSWAHRLASLALVELGRFDEAVASAREAVRRDPADWRCHVALAEALATSAPGEALAAARQAVELAPRQARPHEVLGDAATRMGDAKVARRAYRDALELDPGNDHIRAKVDRLDGGRPVRRTPTPTPAPAFRPARFGRAQRIALWLLIRRLSAWSAVGSFLLLIAGLPSPSPLLAWFGLGLVLFVVGLAGHGWLTLPPGARVGPAALRRAEPLVVTCLVLLCVALLALAVWAAALALGSRDMQLLNLVLATAGPSTAFSWLRLWRLRPRGTP